METKPVTKTRTIVSVVLGCVAVAVCALSAVLIAKLYFQDPSDLINGEFDIAEMFRARDAGIIADALDILTAIEFFFYAYFGAWVAFAVGAVATFLSFNRYPSRLNLLGRITGIVGVVYGIGVGIGVLLV